MDKLEFVARELAAIDVPYEFMQWTAPVAYPYFVGEISELAVTTGDGLTESEFTLTGFYRGKYAALEAAKNRIREHFHPLHGLRGQTDSGVIFVFFSGAFYVPSGEPDLKKLQINLEIKEWRND